MRGGATVLALAGALGLACPPAHANPLDAFGYGSRAAAMGSAYAAVAADGAAGYYNPAGLARAAGLAIDVGYQAAVPELHLSGVRQPIEPTRGMLAGIVAPGHLGPVRFAFGITLFLPDQHITRLRVLRFETPRLQLYDNRTQRLFFAANLALHLGWGLHLGGGLSFMSRTRGTVHLRGRVAIGDADDSALWSSTDVDLVALRYPQLGLVWLLGQHLALAAVYRHSFVLEIDQAFEITADLGNPGQEPVVRGARLSQRAQSTDLFQPWQVVLGAALRVPGLEQLLLSLDVTFARWSEMPVPAARYELSLDIGRFNDLVRLQPSASFPPPGFSDILIPALGAEWQAAQGLLRGHLDLDVRGGYRYEPSPVPEQEGDSSFGDADKHTFSLGAGATLRRLSEILPRPLSLDVHLALTALPERSFRKRDPRSPVGDFTAGGVVVQVGGHLRWSM
ncbi:MAG: outer membrane protein transport protein [Myxococcota bacterium]|nr:outer membrane protein transport protein [Myxococcota bacterium]